MSFTSQRASQQPVSSYSASARISELCNGVCVLIPFIYVCKEVRELILLHGYSVAVSTRLGIIQFRFIIFPLNYVKVIPIAVSFSPRVYIRYCGRLVNVYNLTIKIEYLRIFSCNFAPVDQANRNAWKLINK